MANDLYLRILAQGVTVFAGMALEDVDNPTDMCADVWQPVVSFVLNPDGTATVVVTHDDRGSTSPTSGHPSRRPDPPPPALGLGQGNIVTYDTVTRGATVEEIPL